MNNIDQLVKRPIQTDALKYGIAILHAILRFLEYVLNMAYRFEVQKWRVNLFPKILKECLLIFYSIYLNIHFLSLHRCNIKHVLDSKKCAI